jgi:hypothetical protein
MEEKGFLKNSQIIVLGVCIAVATIASSVILSQGFLKVTKFVKEQISVTGSAQKLITSDRAVWRGSFSVRGVDLQSAYKNLKDSLEKVKKYLVAQGIGEKEIIASQITTETIYKKTDSGVETNDILAYRLTQSVEVVSSDVAKITDLARSATELINQGIEFYSQSPEYFYTKLEELKVEMLAKASENAKQRAENMVKATGNKIGFMRSARMGVFQITPASSTEVSDWGLNDTSSMDKKVTAVVSASFAIE